MQRGVRAARRARRPRGGSGSCRARTRSSSSSPTRESSTPTGRAPRFARGLRIEENHRVESIDDLDEEVVVVCAGPWARRLLAPHGIDLPVVETRETIAYFRLEGEIPSVVAEVVTKGHGFYSLADPVYGLKVGAHMRGKPADPDVVEGADPALVEEIAEWTASRFPAADPEPVGAQSCFYTTTDDERFILERHGRIVVGSACSGHGFKFAPAVGKRLAALAVD